MPHASCVSCFVLSDFSVVEVIKQKTLAGVAVVVVIAVLFALAGLAYIYQRWSKNRAATPSYENPMYYNTEAPCSEDKDTKTLVDHMENNE